MMAQSNTQLDDESQDFLTAREAQDLDLVVREPNPLGYEPLAMPPQFGQRTTPVARISDDEIRHNYDEAVAHGFQFFGESSSN